MPSILVELKATITDFEMKMATVRKELDATSSQSGQKLGSLAASAQGMLGTLTSAFASLPGVATGATTAVAGAVAGFVAKGIKDYTALAESVRNYSQATGVSTEQSSVAIAQAAAFKVPVEALTKSMALLAANVQLHPAYFQRWGVEIAKNADGSTNMATTLANLTQRFHDTTDATTRDAMAKQLMGRGYQQLLPLLNATPEVLKEIAQAAKDRGEILSQKDIDQAMAFRRALTELRADVQAFGVQAGKAVVPLLLDMARGMERVMGDIDKFTSSIGGLTTVFHVLSATMAPLSEVFVLLGGSHKSAGDAALKQAQAEQQLSDQLKQTEDNVTAAGKAVDGLINAQQGMAAANKGVTDANGAVADAQANLNDVLTKGAVDTKAIKSAEDGLASANKGVADASQRVGDAQESLNDLLSKGAVDAKQVESAQRSLQSATRSTKDAVQGLADAQQHLIDVEKGATALDKEEAQLRVKDATNQLARAQENLAKVQASGTSTALDISDAQNQIEQSQIDLAKSQQTLNDVMTQGTPGSKDYKDARDQVTKAEQALKDAQQSQRDAAKQLRDAEAGDPDFAKKVARAKRDLAGAEGEVSDAKDRQRDAADKLNEAEQSDPDFTKKVEDAQRRLADASDQVTAAKWKQYDAAKNLFQAQRDENDALGAGAGVSDSLRQQLEDIAKQSPEVAGVVTQIEQMLGTELSTSDVVGKANTASYNNVVNMLKDPNFLPIVGPHAAGGPFRAGDTMLVGEQGPELVRFGTGGQVTDAATTGAIMSAASQVLAMAMIGGATKLVTDKVLNAAAASAALGYVSPLGGGSFDLARTDEGVDFIPTSPEPIVAMGPGVVNYSSTTTGWPGGAFVEYQLSSGPRAGSFVYTAEHLTDLASVGTKLAAGQRIATALPGYPWLEMGWGSGVGDSPLSTYNGAPDGTATAGGIDFATFLNSIGVATLSNPHPTPVRTSAAGGSLAAVLGAIKQHESGGNYSAQNPYSTASGAYQFLTTTWASEAQAAGYGQWANGPARLAPAGVQDAVALFMATQALPSLGGNLLKLADIWYIGHVASPRELNVSPGGPGNFGLTPAGYEAQIAGLMAQGYDQGGWLQPGLTLAYNGTGRPEQVIGPNGGGGDVHVHFHGNVYAGPGGIKAITDEVRQQLLRDQRVRVSNGFR